MHRFYIVSAQFGLIAVTDTAADAEHTAVAAAVATGRTVYLHDRLTELAR